MKQYYSLQPKIRYSVVTHDNAKYRRYFAITGDSLYRCSLGSYPDKEEDLTFADLHAAMHFAFTTALRVIGGVVAGEISDEAYRIAKAAFQIPVAPDLTALDTADEALTDAPDKTLAENEPTTRREWRIRDFEESAERIYPEKDDLFPGKENERID